MREISPETEAYWLDGDFTDPTRRPMVRASIQRLHVRLFNYNVGRDETIDWNHSGKFASAVWNQDGVPREIRNIQRFTWTRSVDQDVATATMVLNNTQLASVATIEPPNDDDFDLAGWYTPNRGDDGDDFFENQWNYDRNPWFKWFLPDRIIRTFEGYGLNLDVPPEEDENLYPSGVWLIDDVTMTSDGEMTLELRDLGRMLLDCIAFPPVVPNEIYPLWFSAYEAEVEHDLDTSSSWTSPTHVSNSNLVYEGNPNATTDQNVTSGAVHGHVGADAFDDSGATRWMSVGLRQRDYAFIEGSFTSQDVAAIKFNLRGGPYRVFVSLYSGGEWIGRSKVPYDPDDYLINIGANIKYVQELNVNGDKTVALYKTFTDVTKIRLTFTHLYDSGIGVNLTHRAIVQDVSVSDTVEEGSAVTRQSGNYDDYCVDTETEILTRRGWLRYDEVQIGDHALAIDPATGTSSWQVIEDIFRKHRRREMISMESQQHSSLSTPDHRWLIKDHRGRWEWRVTETLRHGHSIPTTVPREDCPQEQKWSDALVELVAWFWTEGWTVWQGNSPGVRISQSRKVNPSYCARIEACLRTLLGEPGQRRGRLGSWSMRERSDGVVTYSIGVAVGQEILALAPNKVPTPEFLTSLTQAQLRLFVETSVDADGWRPRGGGGARLTQNSDARLRSFEMACALAGIATSRFGPDQQGVSLLQHDTIRPSLASRKRVDYDGIIWCPTLRHHNWLARRNGKVYFTGNTQVVKWLCAWGGFYWPPVAYQKHVHDDSKHFHSPAVDDPVLPRGRVWGDFMGTGVAGVSELGVDVFDKRPLMDGIAAVREITGFVFWVDETGGVIWRLPNVFERGCYVTPTEGGENTGRTTNLAATIDENQTLIEMSSTLSSANVRERVFIGNAGGKFGATVRGFNPAPSNLRRVGGWTDQDFKNEAECRRMADVIALRQALRYRQNSLTIAANPAIQIDDQVKIIERQTGEGYVHRVTGITMDYDTESGKWSYQLKTHWMGDEPNVKWAFDFDELDAVTKAYLNAILGA